MNTPTPITDQIKRDLEDSTLNIETACEHLLDSHADIERQLAEAHEARDYAKALAAELAAALTSLLKKLPDSGPLWSEEDDLWVECMTALDAHRKSNRPDAP